MADGLNRRLAEVFSKGLQVGEHRGRFEGAHGQSPSTARADFVRGCARLGVLGAAGPKKNLRLSDRF